jgi:hypothetical protein
MILTTPLEEPSKSCFVCSSNTVTLRLNPTKVTLKYFIDNIVKANLNLTDPLVFHGNAILFDCSSDQEDDERDHFEAQGNKTLSLLGIGNNSVVRLEDDSQHISIDLLISAVDALPPLSQEETSDRIFELISEGDIQRRDAHDVGLEKDEGNQEDVMIVPSTKTSSTQSLASSSSSTSTDSQGSPAAKRRKLE